MDGNFAKSLIDRWSGYWLYKSRQLPIGTDFQIDITRKLGCRKVSTVFDVGANFGQTYLKFRRYFPSAQIYCFEPVAGTFAQLEKTLSGDFSAKPERLAFGPKSGSRTIRLFENAPGLNSLREDLMNNMLGARQETVQVATIDDYCDRNGIQNIDLLKIDAEGFEVPVLEGARTSLERGAVSMIVAEVGFDTRNGRNSPFSDVVEYLLTFDYRFFGLYEVTHDFEFGVCFGNALFVRGSLLYPDVVR